MTMHESCRSVHNRRPSPLLQYGDTANMNKLKVVEGGASFISNTRRQSMTMFLTDTPILPCLAMRVESSVSRIWLRRCVKTFSSET